MLPDLLLPMQLIDDEDTPEDIVLEEAPNKEAEDEDEELKDEVSSHSVDAYITTLPVYHPPTLVFQI